MGQPAAAAPQQTRPATPQAPSPNAVPPHIAQAQRAGSPRLPLFTESARPPAPEPQPAPRSLFGIVTGALRRHSTPPQPEPAPRTEPAMQPQQPQPQQPQQPQAQPTGGNPTPDDGGLDIPAFLRRRSP
ncbi:hypothetical protein BFX83_14985 [Komagataeibacter xylinus]|nr:hypothetical protein BFX83_14985 [Komagataeibacter xylinus]